MDILDIAVRLGVATLVGVLLGLNRDLHGKSTGVRTLGLVCLGSALAVLSIHAATGAEESRVIQGIVTGVGFLGAGGIFRSQEHSTKLGKGMGSDLPGVCDPRRRRPDRPR